MSTGNNPKILVFGAGSVGTLYLYLLSKVASVTAVCRSNYEIVKKDGFIINSTIFGENIHFTPNVVKTCTEAAQHGPFDYIVVCSKAIPNMVPEVIQPAVTLNHTAIVLIQNGIGIEEEYVNMFPGSPIVSGVAYLPVTQRPAGVINHKEVERLELGNYPASSKNGHAATFAKLVQDSGATAELYDDVQSKRWTKLLVNASWNPLCALTLCTDVEFIKSSSFATDFVRSTMLEVADIANAWGHGITKDQVEHQLGRAVARVETNKGIEPSMLQDAKEGRTMEFEAIVGNVVRLGKEKGVKCEKLETLYILGTALNAQVGLRPKK
ncbi:2-dehydropantoate 2-reductase [Dendryphion nanum]|uniref:2-dehydropantoate 2-reductase n=1 Tax=Dendryphion nanum TaxID=256645 RepID=A0A9P9DH51_9PLEO|nr:2-dehydropantoate 2-reductase [Dendryphion nanum]